MFCFCIEVLYVLSDRHPSVVGHFKCGGVIGVWEQLTVQRDGWLSLFHGVMSVTVNCVVETFGLFV